MRDDVKIGSLEAYTLCVMMISLDVRKFGSLRDDWKCESLEVWRSTYCA